MITSCPIIPPLRELNVSDEDSVDILVVAPINYCFRIFGTQLALPQRDMPSSVPLETCSMNFVSIPLEVLFLITITTSQFTLFNPSLKSFVDSVQHKYRTHFLLPHRANCVVCVSFCSVRKTHPWYRNAMSVETIVIVVVLAGCWIILFISDDVYLSV